MYGSFAMEIDIEICTFIRDVKAPLEGVSDGSEKNQNYQKEGRWK
jgi:hypothetical protein